MPTTARTQEPFDSWYCQLSTHLSGGVSILCPLWARGQTARLLNSKAQPFDPWFEEGVASQIPGLGTGTKLIEWETLPWRRGCGSFLGGSKTLVLAWDGGLPFLEQSYRWVSHSEFSMYSVNI